MTSNERKSLNRAMARVNKGKDPGPIAGMGDPARMEQDRMMARKSEAHQDRRTKRNRDRSTNKRNHINESKEN